MFFNIRKLAASLKSDFLLTLSPPILLDERSDQKTSSMIASQTDEFSTCHKHRRPRGGGVKWGLPPPPNHLTPPPKKKKTILGGKKV